MYATGCFTYSQTGGQSPTEVQSSFTTQPADEQTTFMKRVDDWLGENPTVHDQEAAQLCKDRYVNPEENESFEFRYLSKSSPPPIPPWSTGVIFSQCGITTLSAADMPDLTGLKFIKCPDLTHVSGEFTKLTHFTIFQCNSITSISGSQFPKLETLDCSGNKKLASLTENFQNVTYLKATSNPELITFASFPSLARINLRGTPKASDWSILFNAQGEFVDPSEHGVKFLEGLSEKGNSAASLKLAELYYAGQIVEKDHNAVMKYLQKANDDGKDNPDALLKLAEVYLKGELVEKNDKQANIYLQQAIDTALPEQIENVKECVRLLRGENAGNSTIYFNHEYY